MTQPAHGTQGPRRIWRWLLVIVAVLLAAELLARGILLVRGPRPADDLTRLYTPHPYRVYMLVPGARSARGDISVNSHGFRGPEIDRPKSTGTVRIACLGGTTTFNDTASTDAHTYPAHMERFLRDQYGAGPPRIEVINAGHPGYTSLESLIFFESWVLDYDLDIAIFHHAIADAVFLANFREFASDYTHARTIFRAPRPRLWERSAVVRLFSIGGGKDRVAHNRSVALAIARRTLTDPDRLDVEESEQRRCFQPERLSIFERHVRNFIYVARGHRVLPVLSTELYDPEAGFFADVVEQVNARIREVARSHSVPCIDYARAMPWSAEVFVDHFRLRDGPDGLERKGKIFARDLVDQGLIEKAVAATGGETDRGE